MKKLYLPMAVGGIVILAVLAVFQWKNLSNQGTPPPTPSGNAAEEPGNKFSAASGQEGAGELAGVLNKSDNLQKGNLMLETPGRNIYLHTSRDYTALLGREVTVSIEGTVQSFNLIEIKAK